MNFHTLLNVIPHLMRDLDEPLPAASSGVSGISGVNGSFAEAFLRLRMKLRRIHRRLHPCSRAAGYSAEVNKRQKTKKQFFVYLLFWIPPALCGAGMTLWTILPSVVQAVGISVSPPALELKGAPDKKITGTFTVTNPSRETVIYEITNDGLLTLAITPTTFLLEPGKKAKVAVEYASQKLTTHYYQLTTHLSILGRPLTVQPTQAASGIKLPVSISVGFVAGASTRRLDPITAGIILLDVVLLVWLIFLFNKKLHRSPRSHKHLISVLILLVLHI